MGIPFVGKKNSADDDASSEPRRRVIPSVSLLALIRRVHEHAVEDYSGNRFAVWSVRGMDSNSAQVMNGWTLMLNSVEYPIQVLIRQHAPDLSDVRRKMLSVRPEHMRKGRINDVGNSMLDYLKSMEDEQGVVAREWYVIASEARSMEIMSVMVQSGFAVERLEDEELGMLVQACVSGMGYGYTRDIYQAQEHKNHLELNQRYVATYEVTQWPRRMSVLFLEQLLRGGDEMDVSIWIWPASQRESHTRLQMQRSRFEGSRLVAMQKGKLIPPEVDLAIADVTRISERIEQGRSKLFRRTMNLAVYGRSQQDLKEVCERVSGYFRSNLSRVNPLKLREAKGFQVMMPALRPGLNQPDLTDSDTMIRMFPFGPLDLNDRDGVLLGMDLRSRTPIIYNAFHPKAMNGHMVIMARSGAGKSFWTKLIVTRESLIDIPIYLIDPEGEYGVITQQLGGEVFVPGSPGFGLNPFAMSYTQDEDDLISRITSLGSLVGVMLEGQVDTRIKAAVDQCLWGFYKQELISVAGTDRMLGEGGMKAFHEYLQSPDAKDIYGAELAHLLSTFATGSARHLMQASDRNLLTYEAPVTSFNLKNLPSNLKPVATSICSEVVWSLAVSKPRPRRLVVDECWTVLATPSGAEALINIVKRARKYKLGLMTITQDVQDFLSENPSIGSIVGHAGRSLLQNSAMKLALSQDPAALPQVVEALGLTSDEGDFLAGSLRGQGLLINENGICFPIDIVSTTEERDLVTDEGWRTHGENLTIPEADLNRDLSNLNDSAFLERIERERASDEIMAS